MTPTQSDSLTEILAIIMGEAIQIQIPNNTKDYTGVTAEINVLDLHKSLQAHIDKLLVEARYFAEVWKPIVGYESEYEVSSAGRVRSLPRTTTSGGLLKLVPQPTGYLGVTLSKANVRVNALVHRLVGWAFVDNPKGKNTINHKNGDKTDNSASNLEWTTYSENELHSYRELGKVNSQAKLTAKQIREIKVALKTGTPIKEICLTYGLDRSTAYKVKKGMAFKYV